MRAFSTVLVTLCGFSLAACGSNQKPRNPTTQAINRVLVTAPGAAQPSTLVKTEIAYNTAARETGQYTAALAFSNSGALLHGRNGPVDFAQLATVLNDPPQANQWGPRTVVMSCDGALAVTKGRFRDSQGYVGNYVTTWVRQPDLSYKWSYDVAGRDNPQPPPRPDFQDGDIVVTAIDLVEGLIATCPGDNQTIPPPPPIPVGEEGAADAQLARDGTLRWRWEHRADGTKYVTAQYFYLGEWLTAIEESLTSPLE